MVPAIFEKSEYKIEIPEINLPKIDPELGTLAAVGIVLLIAVCWAVGVPVL
jgi:hypothetical protein